MSIYSLSSLIAGVVSLSAGCSIYIRQYRSPLNQTFAALCLLLGYTGFTEFGFRQAVNVSSAQAWLYANSLWPLVIAAFLHFTLLYINDGKPLRRYVLGLVYIPAILIITFSPFDPSLIGEPVKVYWGWTYSVNTETPFSILIDIWAGGSALLCLSLLVRHRLKADKPIERKRSLYLVTGISLPILGGVHELISPYLAMRQPEMTVTGFAFGMVPIAYAIAKYRLFFLSPELLAKQLRDNMNDLLIITNAELLIREVNLATLKALGFLEDELVGQPWEKILPQGASVVVAAARDKVKERAGFSNLETIFLAKDGHEIDISLSCSIIRIPGESQAILFIGRDITERKKLRAQLMAQDRLASIGQLVSGVAHEINNPLTSVLGFSDLLLQRDLPVDIKDDLKIVNDEAKRTSLIVRNLLTFGQQQPQEKQAIDFNEPIRVALQLRSHAHRTNNIKVNAHLAPDLPSIIGNGSQLQQVFLNIITNAEQAMLEAHKKGTLTITTDQKGSFVRASFADDGPGILQENMRKLFTPFFTTKEVGKGTGLGLSICHGIVTEHNGRIWAESEPGKGATFVVELPVNKASSQEEATRSGHPSALPENSDR